MKYKVGDKFVAMLEYAGHMYGIADSTGAHYYPAYKFKYLVGYLPEEVVNSFEPYQVQTMLPGMTDLKYNVGDKFIVEIEDMFLKDLSLGVQSLPVYRLKNIPGLYDDEHLKRFVRLSA